jgi:hypothetical protein
MRLLVLASAVRERLLVTPHKLRAQHRLVAGQSDGDFKSIDLLALFGPE